MTESLHFDTDIDADEDEHPDENHSKTTAKP